METYTLDALRRAAEHRIGFLRGLAERLSEPEDHALARREAADVIMQLLEDATGGDSACQP